MTSLLLGAAIALVSATGWALSLETRAARTAVVRAWARARDIAEPASGRYVVRERGIPVEVRARAHIEAVVRYPFGAGPKFRLASPFPRPIARAPGARLAETIRTRHRRFGAARSMIEPVARAVEREVQVSMRSLSFASDGVELVVQLRDNREVTDIDAAVGLAAALVAREIEVLAPLAAMVKSTVEIGQDGLAFLVVGRRAPLRVTIEMKAGASLTHIVGAVSEERRDLVDAEMVVGPAAPGHGSTERDVLDGISLRALRQLRDALVIVRPREIEVRLVGHPPPERIVRVLDAVEPFLLAPAQTPFR